MADFCQSFIDNITKETQRINELNELLSDPGTTAEPGVKQQLEKALQAAQLTQTSPEHGTLVSASTICGRSGQMSGG